MAATASAESTTTGPTTTTTSTPTPTTTTTTSTTRGTKVKVDFEQHAILLEEKELRNGASPCTAQLYSQLLALYLLQNDLCNAKCLWKRIPTSIKQNTPELSTIWAVGQKMWQKDFPGIYECLQKEWSEDVKDIMAHVHDSVRHRALHLVRLAYSSIRGEDFAVFIGMTVDKAIEAAQNEGWETDVETRIIIPKKLEPETMPEIQNEYHLSVLTGYVTFLEN